MNKFSVERFFTILLIVVVSSTIVTYLSSSYQSAKLEKQKKELTVSIGNCDTAINELILKNSLLIKENQELKNKLKNLSAPKVTVKKTSKEKSEQKKESWLKNIFK